ncbi:hypothetical protein [Cupriavidus taiwanensis]|uniref:hypothetical protein n=1 Tax=Cupriavidus taiwanensis TaxID=164546 RepID=UPI000E1AA1CD|nr:hypothetical protein [Cupriavidus taiwanensis]SPC18460.1 conserved hypothetical protein [Cupriavidus taiwanensis]
MDPLHPYMFDVYALALPKGLSFDEDPPVNAWADSGHLTVGALTQNRKSGKHGVLIMRRREDHVWAVLRRDADSFSEEEAMAIIRQACEEPACPVLVPSGARRRTPLWDLKGSEPSGIFKLLGQPCRERGAWMLNQLYLAMPNPDPNWPKDCQTDNFHTRLWEALLLASFREQGLLVTQEYPSPDFHITNSKGGNAWVEAVTTNPPVRYDHASAGTDPLPQDRRERMLGAAAERYARTLRNKLNKGYTNMPHVAGTPFAIAIADFHAPGSMMWSREALIAYLYGLYVRKVEREGKVVAAAEAVDTLPGDPSIRAGLFFTPEGKELSAVIFSNGASLAKLSRVPISFGGDSGDYRYVRIGEFVDDTPGALNGIPFSMDVNSNEYRDLWKPYGYEPWTAEIEVFHNPKARHRINPALLPEATHWLPINGVLDCRRYFRHSVLKSQTLIQPSSEPIPTVDSLVFQDTYDSGDMTDDQSIV